MFLLAIYAFSLGKKFLSVLLSIFKMDYLGFSLSRYLSFLYILDIKPVLENIFSSSIHHIFILLIVYFDMDFFFYFDVASFPYYFFFCLCFRCNIQKIISKINVKNHFPHIFF